MKYSFSFFCISLFLFLTFTSCLSQNKGETPQAVKDSFQKKYPGENDPDWELDKNYNYEAHFKKKGVKYKADFSPSGEWIETETKIKKKDLPKPVKEAIKKKYDNLKIEEIEKVDHATKGIFYDVEFISLGEKVDVEFNSQGEKIN